MGLRMSKCCYSYSFYPMSAKLYEDIGYHAGMHFITFLGSWTSFKNFVAL